MHSNWQKAKSGQALRAWVKPRTSCVLKLNSQLKEQQSEFEQGSKNRLKSKRLDVQNIKRLLAKISLARGVLAAQNTGSENLNIPAYSEGQALLQNREKHCDDYLGLLWNILPNLYPRKAEQFYRDTWSVARKNVLM